MWGATQLDRVMWRATQLIRVMWGATQLDRVMWGATQLEILRPATYREVFHSKSVRRHQWHDVENRSDGKRRCPTFSLLEEMRTVGPCPSKWRHRSFLAEQNRTQHLPLATYKKTLTRYSLQLERLELLGKSVRTTPHIPHRKIYRPKKSPSPSWDTVNTDAWGKSQLFFLWTVLSNRYCCSSLTFCMASFVSVLFSPRRNTDFVRLHNADYCTAQCLTL